MRGIRRWVKSGRPEAPPPGQPAAPNPDGKLRALAMTAAQPTGAVPTISAMAHGGLPGEAVSRVKLRPMTGHGGGRDPWLTVIAE